MLTQSGRHIIRPGASASAKAPTPAPVSDVPEYTPDGGVIARGHAQMLAAMGVPTFTPSPGGES